MSCEFVSAGQSKAVAVLGTHAAITSAAPLHALPHAPGWRVVRTLVLTLCLRSHNALGAEGGTVLASSLRCLSLLSTLRLT